MRIEIIRISPEIALKIFNKHGLRSEEVEKVLKEGNPLFKRVGGNQYVCVGRVDQFITVFFTYDPERKQATVTTAYRSDAKQKKSYKKIRGK